MKGMRKWVVRMTGVSSVLALGSAALADAVALPDLGITATDYTTGMAAKVGPWIAGGLALAVVILAVLRGWRKFKSAAK
jgi:hypothetical protein